MAESRRPSRSCPSPILTGHTASNVYRYYLPLVMALLALHGASCEEVVALNVPTPQPSPKPTPQPTPFYGCVCCLDASVHGDNTEACRSNPPDDADYCVFCCGYPASDINDDLGNARECAAEAEKKLSKLGKSKVCFEEWYITEALPAEIGNDDDLGLPSNDEFELAYGQDDVIPPTYSSCNSAASLTISWALGALMAGMGSLLVIQGNERRRW